MRFAHSSRLTCSRTDFCFLMRVTLMTCSSRESPIARSLTPTTRLRAYGTALEPGATSMRAKKRYPGGYLFALLGARLRLAPAGARQELLVQGCEVDRRIPTAPAEDRVSAHVRRGHRHGRVPSAGALQRNQGDHRAVDGRGNGGGEALYRHNDLAVGVGLNQLYVLRGPALRGVCDFAAPEVGLRRRGGTLIDLGNRGAACARSQDHFGYLRPVAVILVRRECYCGQNADDRNHDHQLDQGKALLNCSHGHSFFNTPVWRLGG